MQYIAEPTSSALILCCGCGVAIAPNPSNMCVDCIRNEVDITDGIPKQLVIYFCRTCERYLQPPNIWVIAGLESRELLQLCLRKLRGLSKVRLVDAAFAWTEPHSRRIKVKLTIQKEVFANTVLQQIFIVEYIVNNQQCDTCERRWANDHWNACVQLRQKVEHKKTFYYLEQLMLKHNAHSRSVNIKESPDGLDFYFSAKADAVKLCDFLSSVVPTRLKTSQRLISHDTHTNVYNYKRSYFVEISPICKDDLICLPPKLARSMGNISPLVLCSRVTTCLRLVDPLSLQHAEVNATAYWRAPFVAMGRSSQLVQYVVLEVQPVQGAAHGKYHLADIEVARMRDFGVNDTTFFARTHLGALFKCGDYALGYDMTTLQINDEHGNDLDSASLPDVVIVRKMYQREFKTNRKRAWHLKQMNKEKDDTLRKRDEERAERDYEQFLDEVERDRDFRAHMNLYKNDSAVAAATNAGDAMAVDGADINDDQSDAYSECPDAVGLDELLEDMTIDDSMAPDADDAEHHLGVTENRAYGDDGGYSAPPPGVVEPPTGLYGAAVVVDHMASADMDMDMQ